jgi:hypothetical protein
LEVGTITSPKLLPTNYHTDYNKSSLERYVAPAVQVAGWLHHIARRHQFIERINGALSISLPVQLKT